MSDYDTDILVVTKLDELRMPQGLQSVHSAYSICAVSRGLSHRRPGIQLAPLTSNSFLFLT